MTQFTSQALDKKSGKGTAEKMSLQPNARKPADTMAQTKGGGFIDDCFLLPLNTGRYEFGLYSTCCWRLVIAKIGQPW